MADETMSDRIVDMLATRPGPVSFEELVYYVTPPGDCVDCAKKPVRRMLKRLIRHGEVGESAVVGYEAR